jgi:general secretion pathway protein A
MSVDVPWQPKQTVSGPTLHRARSSALTYETFYGLREKPFSLASDPAFFYSSRSHARALEDLQSGIRRRESLSVLSGDIGTGKTTLCRAVLEKLDQKTFSAFVTDPFASREDLLKVVLMDFGVVSADDIARGRLKGATRTDLSYLLYEFLDTLTPLQAFAVVFIDEAQNLSVPLLEEIRILSDSDGRERQLQVVLVGQLELRDKLRLPEMRQVDQRVSVRCSLEPLDRAGVAGYVAHRLEVAGGSGDRVSFSADAVEAVYDASGGVPRLINRLCDRALHQAHLRQAAVIDRDLIATALPDMESASAPRDIPQTLAAPHAPERVDQWFATVDHNVMIASESQAMPEPRFADALPPPSVVPGHRVQIRSVPLTHMEAFTREWMRRAQVAALVTLIIGGAGLGMTVAWAILSQPVSQATLPALPAEPRHAAAVKTTGLSANPPIVVETPGTSPGR